MMANPGGTNGASRSLVAHGEGQHQRCRDDNQQLLHSSLLWVFTADRTQTRSDEFYSRALICINDTVLSAVEAIATRTTGCRSTSARRNG
jgi:hypothetical protein